MSAPACQRVVVREAGGPEVLVLEEVSLPEPSRGAVRLAVETIGVAFGDIMRRKGVLAPRGAFTPGYDVVGVVEAVGNGVSEDLLGQRVASLLPGPGLGAYASHVTAPASRLAPVPEGLDSETAVALGLNYITAWQLLTRVSPRSEGDVVLVHGAAGGVGTAVLDLGQHLGLRVIGTASAAKHERVRARGGEPIDYKTEDFVARTRELTEGHGADLVIDGIGGAHLRRSYAALAEGGTLIALGVSGDVDQGLAGVVKGLSHMLSLKLRWDGRGVNNYGIGVSPACGPRACRDDFEALMALGAQGALSPELGCVLPLAEVAEAHRRMEAREVVGKVVLRVG